MHHLITKISLMEDPRTGNAKIHKLTDYVHAVKKNQGRLLEDIEDTAKLEKPDSIYTETSGDAYVRTIP